MSEPVFVYGTLRRGASNHWRMAGATHLADGAIKGRLYQIDWFPGLLLDERGDDITGEVYAASDELLAALDVFEGVAADEGRQSDYRRVKTRVTTPQGELTAWVWEWLGPVEETRRIASGDWLAD